MSIDVFIHKTHRRHTDGKEQVPVQGGNIGQCLQDLVKKHPGMESVLFSEKGKLKNTVEIYLNMTSAYPDELRKPVNDGDKIHIALMLAGG